MNKRYLYAVRNVWTNTIQIPYCDLTWEQLNLRLYQDIAIVKDDGKQNQVDTKVPYLSRRRCDEVPLGPESQPEGYYVGIIYEYDEGSTEIDLQGSGVCGFAYYKRKYHNVASWHVAEVHNVSVFFSIDEPNNEGEHIFRKFVCDDEHTVTKRAAKREAEHWMDRLHTGNNPAVPPIQWEIAPFKPVDVCYAPR